jgi:class 3 adenylate cyclase
MPMFLDRHEIDGATAEDVAHAHLRDLEVQEKFGVRYLTYWFDYNAGRAFCLAEAPNAGAAEAVHKEAHGLVASTIIEVDPTAVESFLGRIQDTSAAREPDKPVSDVAFRTILFSDMKGSTNLTQRMGDEAAMRVIRAHNSVIREALAALGGREVKHTGDGMMASFASVTRAVECSIAIQRGFDGHNRENPDMPIRVRIGAAAGEPVEDGQDLFGAAVQLASRICDCAEPGTILVSNVVRELAIGKGFSFRERGETEIKGFDELVRLHEVRWREGV